MSFETPHQSLDEIAEKALEHLHSVVRIDSASDESSDTIPSTPGQKKLANELEVFFSLAGCRVERDDYANVIATRDGRGGGEESEPLALMIHLDTARGTERVRQLSVVHEWDGSTLYYSKNESLEVNVDNYPVLEQYTGQNVVHGPGDAPFGLDDKLGLTHLMTLLWLLETNPEIPHPPLIFIARPDEEIGRMEALEGIADLLAERDVRSGYTIDGLDPFEINVENFNAARGSVRFPIEAKTMDDATFWRVYLGGVNTHGATAKAEGHRPATRFAAEILERLDRYDRVPDILPVTFQSTPSRDCDAVVHFAISGDETESALRDAVGIVVDPHVPLGASWEMEPEADDVMAMGGALNAIRFVQRFLASEPGFTIPAEESEGHDGYSQPYRIVQDEHTLRLDVRLRDFDPAGLEARKQHLEEMADGYQVEIVDQYVNMGPRLEDRPELVEWAKRAGEACGVESPVQPIRGGTGVDPFLDRGVAVANLGTGYFAPESEKELTTLEFMAQHPVWLLHLVQAAVLA